MLAQRSALLSRVCGPSTRFAALKPANASRAPLVVHAERFRLNNLSPAPGSRKPEVRKGRGRGSGLGGTCGFGMRGQKARSGRGVRNGFEGGQMPLYRRLPKLRGIAGGNRQGQPNFVVMNVDNLNKKFQPGEEISLETLKERGFVRASGWRRNLPLKILGNGELKAGLTVRAAAFSESAKQKIEAAGGKAELAVGRKKWTRKGHQKVVRELKAQGKDYATEKRKLRVAKLRAKGLVNKKRAQKAGAKAK